MAARAVVYALLNQFLAFLNQCVFDDVGGILMSENSNDHITLFIRDKRTGRFDPTESSSCPTNDGTISKTNPVEASPTAANINTFIMLLSESSR